MVGQIARHRPRLAARLHRVWSIDRGRRGNNSCPWRSGSGPCLFDQHIMLTMRARRNSHCLGVTMVGSPLPAPPRKAESLTQDSSFLSLKISVVSNIMLNEVPSESPDVINDTDNKLFAVFVDADNERVVHDIQVGQEQGCRHQHNPAFR